MRGAIQAQTASPRGGSRHAADDGCGAGQGRKRASQHRDERARVCNQRLAGTCALVAPATALLGVALAPGAHAKLPALCTREGAAGTGRELQGSEHGRQQAHLPTHMSRLQGSLSYSPDTRWQRSAWHRSAHA